MGFVTAIETCLRKYVDFQGRARRSEFWYFRLFSFLAFMGLLLLAGSVARAMNAGDGSAAHRAADILTAVLLAYVVAMAMPSLAVTVRRLHDRNMSGWWFLITFIPFGGLLLLAWFVMKGTDGDNKYGTDPLGEPSAAAVFS